ncbi:glycoside hydrolase family 95 protein [Flavobacterium cellulosilyticum]|uniref:Glycoside hydrolase family 95 protein n=1 Tax=Flavobacterium cellulosilyticum TaxID=2541731 RepID=A0A4R5CHJ1_9FLAO|nr:glycoside hydrolase family 95 protein [Flavobacterium cellulosilyticum]TDD99668.1 glycoside hydrolase family 95 protein [Flavobacterium cellulosilyticum]
MKDFLNYFPSFAFIFLISSITFAQTPKENKSAVIGVVLQGGLTNLKDATGILGIQFKNVKTENWSEAGLTLGAFDTKGKQINQIKTTIDFNKFPEGYQFISFEKAIDLAQAEFLRITLISKAGKNLFTADFKSGSYKGIPIYSNWITHPKYGNGPGVMNPEKVPAGIDPGVENTIKLNVNYLYDDSYQVRKQDNLLWYKTGAFDPKATIYDRDGKDWEEQALPIGNGYLGAMLFGMPGKDHIQFNEESFWAAGYRGVQEKVPSDNVNKKMGEGINGFMNSGNIFVDFNLPQNPDILNYYRDLDINTAVSSVRYQYKKVNYKREYFASYLAKVIVLRYTADEAKALNFNVKPISAHPGNIQVNNGIVTITGKLKDSEPYTGGGKATYNQPSDLEYCTIIKVIADDGEIVDHYGNVEVKNATGVTIFITSATDYDPNAFSINDDGKVNLEIPQFKHKNGLEFAIQKAEGRLANTNNKTYEELKKEHIADYQALFNRVTFSLGNKTASKPIPTNERVAAYAKVIKAIKSGESISYPKTEYDSLDTNLEELFYQYGRYLMIASSRENTLPATLQGKWNQSVAEIWGSTYCININLEMNYWFAGGANLIDSGKALANWIESQIPAGSLTAQNMYNVTPSSYHLDKNKNIVFEPSKNETVDGVFVMHTKQSINGQTDLTGSTSIQSPGNTAFLMYNLWDLFQRSQNKKWLTNQLYPILRKSANFYAAYLNGNKVKTANLKQYPKGYFYTTGKGRSPEHGPYQTGIKYDLQLIAGLLDYTLEAAKILNIDLKKQKVWNELRTNLEKPVELGTDGQIKEWSQETSYNKDATGKDLGDPNHRHISHLVGLYPGNLINPQTPEFQKGAQIVLQKRGDDATGWSIANKFLMWASIQQGDKALELLRYQLAQRTYSNLFDFHAPFQIDGNFGAAAGIQELLLQSNTNAIYLLPALPSVWKEGTIKGIIAKNGAQIEMTWKNGTLENAKILNITGKPMFVNYTKAKKIQLDIDGKSTLLKASSGHFKLPKSSPGQIFTLQF